MNGGIEESKSAQTDRAHGAAPGPKELRVDTDVVLNEDDTVHDDLEDFELRVKDTWWFQVIQGYRSSSELTDAQMALLQGHVNVHISSFPLTTSATAKFLRGLPSTIIILELRNCALNSRSIAEGLFFSNCPSIQSLCLAENLLTSIPFFLDRLKDLRFLDLSHNKLSHGSNTDTSNTGTDISTVKSAISDRTPTSLGDALQMQADINSDEDIRQSLDALRISCSLIYLNLEGNSKLTCHSYYRDMVIATLPGLRALDGHIVCDEELYGAVHGRFQLFPPPFCSGHKNFRLPPSFREEGPDFDLLHEEGEKVEDNVRSTKRKTKMRKAAEGTIMVPVFHDVKTRRMMEIRKHLNVKGALLEQQYRMTSPVVKMQRCVRAWLKWLKFRPLRVYAHLASLQARVRRFLFVQRCKKDLKATLKAAGEWNDVLDSDMVENRISMGNSRDKSADTGGTPGVSVSLQKKLKGSYEMQAHARTVGLFMRTAVKYRRRLKACVKVQRWVRRIWRQWGQNVQHLSSMQVRGLVVPAGSEECVLDVLAHFEDRRRAYHQGSASDNVGSSEQGDDDAAGDAYYEYSAEPLYEVERVFVRRGKKELAAVRAKMEARGRQLLEMSVVKRVCFHPRNVGAVDDGDNDGAVGEKSAVAAARMRLAAHRHGLWRLSAQAEPETKALTRTFRRRGCCVQKLPLLSALSACAAKANSNAARLAQEYPHTTTQSLVIITVPSDRMSVLSDTLLYIHNPRNHYYRSLSEGGVWLDVDVEEEISAIRLQAMWRGVRFRRASCARVMDKLVARRAAVCLQWWWRYRNGLGRRLKLLRTVRSVCTRIEEPILYLDLWSFYWILRQRHLPLLSNALELFPEMRGTPHVTATGRAVMKGLRDDVVNCPQYSAEANKVAGTGSTAAADAAMEGLQHERKDERNFNVVEKVRFGVPQWLPHRPPSEDFYRGRHTDGYHKSRHDYEQEYCLFARRRDLEFPLFDLVTKGVQVRLRPVKMPLDKASGGDDGKEPYSRRWYQEGLHFSPTDAEADLRVVELSFPSLQEARSRAALLVICTYDYLSHSSVMPMSGSEVKDRVYMLRRVIALATQQMMADLNDAGNKEDQDKHKGEGGATLYEEQAENEAPTSGMQVVAPIEKDILLQPLPLAGWITRIKYNVWDLMRFRFLCHCLLVCSNTNVNVTELQQPKVPARIGVGDGADAGSPKKTGREMRVQPNELLTRDVEHSLISFSDSLYSVGGDSPDVSTHRKTLHEAETETETEAGAKGSSVEGSVCVAASIDGVPVPAELYSEIVGVQRHLEHNTELEGGGGGGGGGGDGDGAQFVLALGSEGSGSHQHSYKTASFLASGVVTGKEWSPRDGEVAGLLNESSLEKRELAKVGAAGSSDAPPVPSIPGDASLDGFESEVSGKPGPQAVTNKYQPRPERLYEAKRASSPPSNKQLRSIGLAAGPPPSGTGSLERVLPPTLTHIARSSSRPLATSATAGAGAGANSDTVHQHPAAEISTRWKTTAALSYLKSSVWDAAKVMMWCSRGFDHGFSASAEGDKHDEGGYCSRSLEDFTNVAVSGRGVGATKSSRYYIPVRPNKGHDKERGMNEQKAMVARLEALQLGMYEYAMRLAKLEKVNHTAASAASAAVTAAAARPHSPGDVTPGGTGRGVTAAVAHTAALYRNYYSGTTGVTDALTGNELHLHDNLLDRQVQAEAPASPYSARSRGSGDNKGKGKGKGKDEEDDGSVKPFPSSRLERAALFSSSSNEGHAEEHLSAEHGPTIPAAARIRSESGPRSHLAGPSRSPSPPGRASPINDGIAATSYGSPARSPPGSPKGVRGLPQGQSKAHILPAYSEAGAQPNSARASEEGLAMSTSPIRLRTAPTARPEFAALEEASAAQEKRENDIMMMQSMKAREARDRVHAARIKKSSDAKLRRRFQRRDRAVKSHIRHLQRDDQALVRQYQRDMHVVKTRGRPHPHSREDWARPAHTGYTPGSAYANQVANLAADLRGGLPELSTQSSVAADAGAPKGPVKAAARTVHSPVGVGSPPARRTPAGAAGRTGDAGIVSQKGGRVRVQAHMPPAVREELRDVVSQAQSSMSSFWYQANPQLEPRAGAGADSVSASLDLGLCFSDVKASDAPPGTAKTGRTTVEGWLGGTSAQGWDNYVDYSNDSGGSGSIYDLSGSEADLDSLGIRLDADPNYADLLGPSDKQTRYRSLATSVKAPRNLGVTAGRPSSGAFRKQQWQQSKKDGSSFINTLLANASKLTPAPPATSAASAAASAVPSVATSPRSVRTGATTLSSRPMLATSLKPSHTSKRSSLDREIDLTVNSTAAKIGGLAVEVEVVSAEEALELKPRSKSKGKSAKKGKREGEDASGDPASNRRESLGSVEVGVAHQFVPQRAPKYVVAAESAFFPRIKR